MINLPHEVVRALRGHKAGRNHVLTWDGARPTWAASSAIIPVLHGDPATMLTGLLWFDLDAACGFGFADNFNRANGALASPWSTLGTGSWAVDTNQLKATGLSGLSGAPGLCLAVVDTGAAGIDVQVDLTAMSGPPGTYTGSGGLVWNVVDANNYFLLFVTYSSASVYQVVAGTLNAITSISGTNNGMSGTGTYRVTHTAAGVVTLFKNGSQTATTTGQSWVSGGTEAGLVSSDTGSVLRLDNFVITGATGQLKLWDGTSVRTACMPPA